MTSARSDQRYGRHLSAIAIAASSLPLSQGFQLLFFSFRLLVICNKYNIWIKGKQPRSVENIYLETLFVTKSYESSPPPQRLGQISGVPYVECFCYGIDVGYGSLVQSN